MVVTRKVRVPGKKEAEDGGATTSNPSENVENVEKVLPDASESEMEKDEIEEDEDMETVENIKEELEKTDDSLGKRVSKPTFKVKLAKQSVPGSKKTGWRKYERKYKPEWEEQFSWLQRAPDQSEMAYCLMCRDHLEPRYNGIVKHEQTVKHKARERGEPLPAGQLSATEAFLSAGGRRYRTVWETDFPWVRRAPGDNASQNAYCTVCHEILLPKYNSLLKHQQTIKHQANLESGSSYAKLQSSPAVANAYFREEWRTSFPWVTVDPSGNPGLAYCTVCCKSLTAKKYILSMHQQKAKHIKRAGLTPDEVSELVKKNKEKGLMDMDTPQGKKFYERRYRPAWEREFPFISKAPDGSEYAYCKLCRDYLAPKVNDIRKHMYTMKHRKRAIASGLNVKQESVTLVAGNQGQNEGGLKVVQVPGSNDFTVVPVDGGGQITTTEVLNVIEAAPPPDGMIVAVPGSVGALDPDQVDMSTLLAQENPGMLYHRSMLHEGLQGCRNADQHSDIRIITGDHNMTNLHQLVLAAASPLLRKAILNIDPAGRASDEPMTILLPDFTVDDLNTLLPWLYGEVYDEQQPPQPNYELVQTMAIGQAQTYTKLPEGVESLEQLQRQTQAAAYQTNFGGGQGIQVKPEIDARLAPMDNANIFAVKEWNQQDESSDDDDDNIQDGPVHKLPRGRGRRRRYVQTENGWECVECGLAMSKREYMRGHYEECMGGGKVLPNVPKDLVIVGSEKGGIKRKTEEEGATPDAKKVKHEDEDVLKCFGCKHVYRSLVEMRAHLAAYDRCSASTWVCDECPKTFGAERSLRIHTLQIHQTELICDKCAKNFGTDHKKFLRHLQRAHITEEKKKDRMYKCGECARSFDYEKNLERHLAKHKEGTLKPGDTEQQKEFVCDQCGKVYGNYKSWFYHVKSHSVIYQCQTCPRGFKTPRGLKYHMALHTGIAAFHCGECGKAFITRDKLTLHQKSRHSNERPHACEWCGKGFLLAHKLAEHRRRVHTGEKPFKCNMCDQRFTDSSSLSHHRKRHAGVISTTPRVITQQTITSANGEQAVIVTTGGDEIGDEDPDSEDEAAQAAAALTGRTLNIGGRTQILADGIVFEVHNE